MAMVIRVVSGLAVLKEDNLSLKLNDSRECLPYLQSSRPDDMDGKRTISLNMLTLGTVREEMIMYKALLRTILTKGLVRVLNIEMV